MEELKTLWQAWLANPYARSATVFALTLFLAWLMRWITGRILARWVQRTRTDWDDRLIEIFQSPVFVTIVFIGALYSLWMLNLPTEVFRFIRHVLNTILVLVWTVAMMRLATQLTDWISEKEDLIAFITPRTRPVVQMFIKGLVLGGAIYFLFRAWDSDVTAWLASAGILGIAVGFAAKDTLSNLFSGLFILADAPYKLGDYIVLDGEERGMVTHIGLRSTRILTRDDVEITIPNALISTSKIINESGGPHEKFRARINIGVAYGTDLKHFRQTLMEIAYDIDGVEQEPAPRVRFRSFGDSSLEHQFMVWVARPEMRGRVVDELCTRIHDTFMEKGIEIPFPKRDITIQQKP